MRYMMNMTSGSQHDSPPTARRHKIKRVLVTVALVVAVLLVVGGSALALYSWHNTTYRARDIRRATEAGYAEARHTLPSGTELNYAEGPDNGPALLLLHAQSGAWESYARVLPELAKDFHVYAIDFAGHGESARTPGRYTVHALGQDVTDFITEVIGQPAILSGHSSGGLVAAWVASAAPELVRGVVFEDPPFFSTDADRMPQQFNYVDLARPAHEFLKQDQQRDFTSYYIRHNAWLQYFGGGQDGIATYAQSYRRDRPDEPLVLWYLPPATNETFASMHLFDPEFANAFYTLQWQADFDQAATLERVVQPSILIHANWRITDAGILEGAMTDEDAKRACGLMADCRIQRVNTGHGFHFEDPDQFVELIREIQGKVSGQ